MQILKGILILISGISILQGAAVERNFENILKTINNLTPDDKEHCVKYLFLETQFVRTGNISYSALMAELGLISDRDCKNQLNMMESVAILDLAKKIHESLDKETKKNLADQNIVFVDQQQLAVNAWSLEDLVPHCLKRCLRR